jgi:NAD-dependent deacetylase
MTGFSVDELAARVRAARQVVYLCGAGLSVPSGIRAYRSGPNAVWDSYMTDWGTVDRFLADPAAWWKHFWLEAHGDLFRSFQPNAGHVGLRRLVGRSPADLVVTQNIDGLHRLAGHPEEQLVEIHGRHDRFICSSWSNCPGVERPVGAVDLSRLDRGEVPCCRQCGAPMRPLVLLFDEEYDGHPAYQARRARHALDDADVLAFIGTSFSVGITSYALHCAAVSGALAVNVNLEPSNHPLLLELSGGAQVVLPALADKVAPS